MDEYLTTQCPQSVLNRFCCDIEDLRFSQISNSNIFTRQTTPTISNQLEPLGTI